MYHWTVLNHYKYDHLIIAQKPTWCTITKARHLKVGGQYPWVDLAVGAGDILV